MRKQKLGLCERQKGEGLRNRGEEEVILWATAFQMTGLSWEISVKRARELFSCFPLFRDISCGILLFSDTGVLVISLTPVIGSSEGEIPG